MYRHVLTRSCRPVRALGLLILWSALAGGVCDSGAPDGGGQSTAYCDPPTVNSGWTEVQASHLGYVAPCPYVVRNVGDSLTIGMVVEANASLSSPHVLPGMLLEFQVRDDRGGSHHKIWNYFPFTSSAPLGKVRALPAGRINGAERAFDPGYPSEHDKVDVSFDYIKGGAPSGFAHGYWEWRSRARGAAPAINGPSSLMTGGNGTWRAYPEWDTTGYWYAWAIDGQANTNTSATLSTSFGSSGQHTVRLIVSLADGTADTVVKSITVTLPPISVSILGSETVPPGIQSCYFWASASGGNGNYTYEWTKNGQPIGGDSPALYVSTGSSNFTLAVTVYESGFSSGNASFPVTVSSSAPSSACEVF